MILLLLMDIIQSLFGKRSKTVSTARRLLDYFSSHRDPYPMKLETFPVLCAVLKHLRHVSWKQQVR